MKLNQNILLTISGAVDLNVSGSWISSFNLSKHPGERGYMAWSDWQSSITRAYQTPVCNYPGSIWRWDLICAGIIVTKMCADRGTAPHRDPAIIPISMFSPANTQAALAPNSLFSRCFPDWTVSFTYILVFDIHFHIWLLGLQHTIISFVSYFPSCFLYKIMKKYIIQNIIFVFFLCIFSYNLTFSQHSRSSFKCLFFGPHPNVIQFSIRNQEIFTSWLFH